MVRESSPEKQSSDLPWNDELAVFIMEITDDKVGQAWGGLYYRQHVLHLVDFD